MDQGTVGAGHGWRPVNVGLIVTGQGEQQFLPRLFRHLMADGDCRFEVIRRTGQRTPRSAANTERMLRSGKQIANRDQDQLGLWVRWFLRGGGDFVLVIDDLEWDRRDGADQVVGRYRAALDAMLDASERHRAAVHLLVMMLEAYYFADPDTTNAVLGTNLPEPGDDVETIRHPKNELKRLADAFDEKEHGAQIVARLDIPHILARPDQCRALRTLMTWCAVALGKPEPEGELYGPTRGQIDTLRAALA